MPRKRTGDGASASQKRQPAPLPDAVRTTKKCSTPIASDRAVDKADKNIKTSNRNLTKGKELESVRTVTSCFDPVWNAFSQHPDGSMQWIRKNIVGIGEDFHDQVGDGKVRSTLYDTRTRS
jgi:hypothetical protein